MTYYEFLSKARHKWKSEDKRKEAKIRDLRIRVCNFTAQFM